MVVEGSVAGEFLGGDCGSASWEGLDVMEKFRDNLRTNETQGRSDLKGETHVL